jgi:hypothetical protein
MFSSAPQTRPVSRRAWGIGLGTLIMVGVPAMTISAKTVQLTLPLLLAGALAGAIARDRLAYARPRFDAVSLCLLLFFFYAGLSALWAVDPLTSISVSLMGAVVAVGSIILMQLVRSEPIENALHMGEGLWIGLAVGALYTTAEAGSGQAIKMFVYNALELGPDVLEPDRYFTWENGRLIAIHTDDLTRNAVPIPLLLWPALMAAIALPAGFWRRLICATLLVLCFAAVFLATSEAAKLALLAGLVAYGMARMSTALARYTLSAAWLVASLAIVPLARLARSLDLHHADWLFRSAQIRVTQWSEIAQLFAQSPYFGIGANMTYVTQPIMHEGPAAPWIGTPIPHPHSVYLQIAYELGLIGSALLAAFGVMMLAKIARLDTVQRPFAFALFAAAAVQIGFSYNQWQIWFMCLFGFAAAMSSLGINMQQHQSYTK